MRNKLLSESIKITKVLDQAADGTSDLTSASVDMQNYAGVVFVTSYATAAANNTVKVQVSSDDGGSDAFADVTGTSVDVSGGSDEDVWIDVLNPAERYVRCVGLRGTSTVSGDIWAIQYGPRSAPVDNTTAGTIGGETSVGQDEGTA